MIRATTYRQQPGFSITGRDNHGRRFRIFAKTPDGAREIETAAKRGDSATIDRLLREGK